jgi:8-hydroxy-5-deazaflavin:NADPH oxidoreductase
VVPPAGGGAGRDRRLDPGEPVGVQLDLERAERLLEPVAPPGVSERIHGPGASDLSAPTSERADGRNQTDLSVHSAARSDQGGTEVNVAVLGTGIVGRTLAAKLEGLGHDVVIGTRDVEETLARTEPDGMGNPPYAVWQEGHPSVRLVTFPEAGAHGELVVNATAGGASLAALEAVGREALAGKVIVDVANPLDFSQGRPPVLTVANTDSLGEQIQRAFPDSRVVKTLNTMNAFVMVEPSRVPGDHAVFVAGDDDAAKETVKGVLQEFGWSETSIVDLGGIRSARSTEMYLPLWLSLWGALGTGDFNIGVTRA